MRNKTTSQTKLLLLDIYMSLVFFFYFSYQLNRKLDPRRGIRLLSRYPDVYERGCVLEPPGPSAIRPRNRELEERPVLGDARDVDVAEAVPRGGGGGFSFGKDSE